MMQQKLFVSLILAVLFVVPAAAPAESVSEGDLFHRAAGAACAAAVGLDSSPRHPCRVSDVTRRLLAEDVAQYSFFLRMGAGEREVIRVHRVVRESSPFAPVPTEQAVLMVHGDVWPFEAAFLTSLTSDAAEIPRALPLFLAQNGLDVWGVDLRWTQVSADTTDFGFLADWGISTDVGDIAVALGMARQTRLFGGDGDGRLHLLGWSRGGFLGYAYLNAETRLPAARRQVRGFIPVDIYFKTAAEDRRQAACARAVGQQAAFDAGTFQDATGALVLLLADLAVAAPDAASPVLAGFTNRQAALLVGAATFLLFPPGLEFVPFYHFNGAVFDAAGLPEDLIFTESDVLIDVLAGAAPFEPVKLLLESERIMCDEDDLPFDDHLDEVTVPVLYVGAGGGFGEFGVFSTTLLGSDDVETLVVSDPDADARLFDLGHADIFTARDAETLFWQPILDWLRTH